MGLDRFVSVNLVGPAQRLKWWQSPGALPVLMYHSISDDLEAGVPDYYKVCTSPRRFEEHMKWLAEGGWQGVHLSEGIEILNGRRQAGGKPVVITFDDGFRNYYSHAVPILAKFGFSATCFVVTDLVGGSFNGRECLSWSEIRDLGSAGFAFGSHTLTHPKLWELKEESLHRELIQSRRKLEDELGEPVVSFAHPFAFPLADKEYLKRYRESLALAGYEMAVTTNLGRASRRDDLMMIKRLPANSADDRRLLDAKLQGAYDWLAVPQVLVKQAKRAVSSRRRKEVETPFP